MDVHATLVQDTTTSRADDNEVLKTWSVHDRCIYFTWVITDKQMFGALGNEKKEMFCRASDTALKVTHAVLPYQSTCRPFQKDLHSY